MAKKDVTPNLDVEREDAQEDPLSEKGASDPLQDDSKTVVKNAHATGLGSIGRNDQKTDKRERDFDTY
ncbi:MAG TPA: hypothetical protein VFS22_02780 [Flavisolibacter sp.]|nr:hypothetical protein [Flavisolibacter sp.]